MPVKVHFETHWLYINQDVWDTLSPEDQKVIQEAARKLEDHAFKQAEREDGKYLDLFKQEGAMVYDFSEKILYGQIKFAQKDGHYLKRILRNI